MIVVKETEVQRILILLMDHMSQGKDNALNWAFNEVRKNSFETREEQTDLADICIDCPYV